MGVLFPIDLIYIDENYRVIHTIEHFPSFRISPIRTQASSVLQLPTHTIYSSQTYPGDQLLICAIDEIDSQFNFAAKTAEEQFSSHLPAVRNSTERVA